MLSSISAAVLLAAAGLGWGALALAAAGILNRLAWRERLAWSFALGIGIIGWLAFLPPLAGRVEPWAFGAMALPGVLGWWRLRPPPDTRPGRPDAWTWALVAVMVALAAGDVAEGLAPPGDGDSLAYHFAIARQMLLEKGLVFVPRAADGAVPLLQQAGYLAALSLGGEQAMTLWCTVTGWAAVWLTWAIGRRFLANPWALAAALVVMSTPAFLYGAGSGQVEGRLAAFILVTAFAVAEARKTSALGPAALAGLAAGFCAASKYPGLFVVALAGLLVLGQRRGLAKAVVFGTMAVAAAGQWYAWNWWNTGDPVFPLLFGKIAYRPDTPWNTAQHLRFTLWMATVESPLARTAVEFLLYPLRVTMLSDAALETGRTGLGPFPLLVAPFALAGAWSARRRLTAHALWPAVLLCLGFYVLWFWFGAAQRVRHYLPVLPLAVLAGTVAAEWITRGSRARGPLVLALVATLALQSAAQAVYSRGFVRHLASGESREAYYLRTVAYAQGPLWANAHLGAGDRIVTPIRQWLYLLDVPYLFANTQQQAQLEVRENNHDPAVFWAQMRRHGITHLLLPVETDGTLGVTGQGGLYDLAAGVRDAGCAEQVERVAGPAPAASRTLSAETAGTSAVIVLALRPDGCRWER